MMVWHLEKEDKGGPTVALYEGQRTIGCVDRPSEGVRFLSMVLLWVRVSRRVGERLVFMLAEMEVVKGA